MKEKSSKEAEMLEIIKTFPKPEGFKVPPGFPLPLRDKLWVLKVENSGLNVTDTGVIIPTTIAKNTEIPNVGIIYATGPECSDWLIPGLKIMYNPYVDVQVRIKGICYYRMDERDVYSIIPPDSFVHEGTKSHQQLFREDRREAFDRVAAADIKREEERLGSLEEKVKKTIKRR